MNCGLSRVCLFRLEPPASFSAARRVRGCSDKVLFHRRCVHTHAHLFSYLCRSHSCVCASQEAFAGCVHVSMTPFQGRSALAHRRLPVWTLSLRLSRVCGRDGTSLLSPLGRLSRARAFMAGYSAHCACVLAVLRPYASAHIAYCPQTLLPRAAACVFNGSARWPRRRLGACARPRQHFRAVLTDRRRVALVVHISRSSRPGRVSIPRMY